MSTQTYTAYGPAREVDLFRDYLGRNAYGSSGTSYERAHDEQYFRLAQIGNWLSTTVRIVAGGTDGTPKQRFARLLAAHEEYEAAYSEITALFGAWLPPADPSSAALRDLPMKEEQC